MYESPIRLLTQQLETHMREQHDKQIFEAIQKFGVDVDRDELIKALAYDRDQYDKGYADGRADAQRWISVEERLPENGTHVLAAVKFSGQFSSGGYVCDAFYAERYAISSEFGDELACEYCEEKDEYFLERGWYEVIKNWDDYASVTIADTVTHWMPLPPMPEEVCP